MPPTPPPLPRRPPQPEWPVPKLHFRVEDLEHEGSRLFFKHVDASTVLRDAIVSVYEHLYTPDTVPTKCVVFLSIKSIVAYVWLFGNRVEQVRLVLRSMDGVAHAFGSDTHKEIHLSLEHIVNSKNRAGHEIRGVLTHEMVHCFQHDGNGKCPGGLIEGVAGTSALSSLALMLRMLIMVLTHRLRPTQRQTRSATLETRSWGQVGRRLRNHGLLFAVDRGSIW
jgi:hypothetical protein